MKYAGSEQCSAKAEAGGQCQTLARYIVDGAPLCYHHYEMQETEEVELV